MSQGGGRFLGTELFQELGTTLKKKDQNSRKKDTKLKKKGTKLTKPQAQGGRAIAPLPSIVNVPGGIVYRAE